MTSTPDRPLVRIDSPASLLAVIPYLLGFTPQSSLVAVGTGPKTDRVHVVLRYDLPDPPDTEAGAQIAGHAVGVLAREHANSVVFAGYGPGRLVTPLADAAFQAAPRAGLTLRDFLRVEEGRFWSYLCREPSCCPAEGVPFEPAAHPAAKILASTGLRVLPGRDALADSIAPVTGRQAETMAEATRHAERIAARLTTGRGAGALDRPGLAVVRAAIGLYREGGAISPPVSYAWLALVLQRVRIRDDAWARMDPAHHHEHRRLWTDLVRRAQPGYIAAPACLLAVTAWQGGDGALANIALDRALADTPGYSMALLLRDALAAGAPPSVATPPMTPEEVAAAYTAGTAQPDPPGERAAADSPGSDSEDD